MRTTDDDTDRLIERVAHDMATATPSADIRRGVLTALDTRAARRVPQYRHAWAGAAAIAAISVLGFAVATVRSPVSTNPIPAARTTDGSRPAPASSALSDTSVPARGTRMEAVGTTPRPGMRRAEQAPSEDDALSPGPEPLVVGAVDVAPLDVPSLSVEPLNELEPIPILDINGGFPPFERRD